MSSLLRAPIHQGRRALNYVGRRLQRLATVGGTSISDESDYPAFCARAASDEQVFRNFKVDPLYNSVLEHVTREQGEVYLSRILAQSPELVSDFEVFRTNDLIGNPRLYDYGEYGVFGSTTLRYIKVLSDLITSFGSLDGLHVIEIGVGYGGQCKIISDRFDVASYTLVDLPPVLDLASRYLTRAAVKEWTPVRADQLDPQRSYDLVISNYAFTECNRSVQNEYLEKVLSRSLRGYMTCNQISPSSHRAFGPDELIQAIPGAQSSVEVPLSHDGNYILRWGHTPSKS